MSKHARVKKKTYKATSDAIIVESYVECNRNCKTTIQLTKIHNGQ